MLKTSDIILNKEDTDKLFSKYPPDRHLNNKDCAELLFLTQLAASLKTAKAIRDEISYLDYIDSQLDNTQLGNDYYRAQTANAILILKNQLERIIKELEQDGNITT